MEVTLTSPFEQRYRSKLAEAITAKFQLLHA